MNQIWVRFHSFFFIYFIDLYGDGDDVRDGKGTMLGDGCHAIVEEYTGHSASQFFSKQFFRYDFLHSTFSLSLSRSCFILCILFYFFFRRSYLFYLFRNVRGSLSLRIIKFEIGARYRQ